MEFTAIVCMCFFQDVSPPSPLFHPISPFIPIDRSSADGEKTSRLAKHY